MTKKAFVLLSGGMDSVTCLFKAIYDFKPNDISIEDALHAPIQISWVEAVSIDYGQRHVKEALYAARLTAKLGIEHTILKLDGLLSGKGVMLTDSNVEVPNIDYADIKGVSPTYVPFRNGTMLSAITAHAQKYVNKWMEGRKHNANGTDNSQERLTMLAENLCGIYFGAHAEDAHNWAYPDCTPEFIGAMANAIYVGTYHAVRLITPLEWLTKQGVVELGHKLGVPFEETWSCYKGEELHCGTCPTCRSRRNAFIAAGIPDPTEYAQNGK